MKKFFARIGDLCELLEHPIATLVSGISVLAAFLLPLALGKDLPMYLDPSWIAVALSGLPLLYSAIKKLVTKRGMEKISSALLISIAMAASIAIGNVFAAGEIAFIMALGELLEHKTVSRAKKGLKNLISLTPVWGRRISDGAEEKIPAEHIRVGDVLRILPGETVPVDGTVISGESSIDRSVLTGESLPVDTAVGDEVFCGTLNCFGSIDIRATAIGEDSSLGRLIELVRGAQSKQAPMQRIADRWAARLVPTALLLALSAGLVRFFMGDPEYLNVAVTVLVVFCPCALVLATPTAIMAAIGQATKHGVIIKSGEALERMGKVDTVVFDKTGTLTYGTLTVSDVFPLERGLSEEALLTLAASAEAKSEHPLALATLARARELGLTLAECSDFTMSAGLGISATVSDRRVLCGNKKFMSRMGVGIGNSAAELIDRAAGEGKASVLVADGECVIGVITLCDTLRKNAKRTVSELTGLGASCVLLTGDSAPAAAYLSKQVGISEVHSELLPEDKVSIISELCASGRTVCMVGDGVNDAPALKTAFVGVAMAGVGSDVSVDASDVALVGDDLSKLPYLKRLARATTRTIRFGIALSLVINFAAIVLSFFKLLDPTTGALVHNAGSVLVILIAALLYDRKI